MKTHFQSPVSTPLPLEKIPLNPHRFDAMGQPLSNPISASCRAASIFHSARLLSHANK